MAQVADGLKQVNRDGDPVRLPFASLLVVGLPGCEETFGSGVESLPAWARRTCGVRRALRDRQLS